MSPYREWKGDAPAVVRKQGKVALWGPVAIMATLAIVNLVTRHYLLAIFSIFAALKWWMLVPYMRRALTP